MTGTRLEQVRGNGELASVLVRLGVALAMYGAGEVHGLDEPLGGGALGADAVLNAVRRWSAAHLRRRFPSGRCQLADDVREDASQHLAEVILSGRGRLLPPAVLIAWCKRILDNFVLDEIRRSARHCNIEGICEAKVEPSTKFETTEVATRLIAALREQAVRAAGPARARQRKALLEAYLARALTADPGPSEQHARALWQRRVSRGKQVAVTAWRALQEGIEGDMQELVDVASALGLDCAPANLGATRARAR